MTVSDEDVAVTRHGNLGRRVELVETRARFALLAERHQDLAFLTELEDLVAAVVGDPEKAVLVDRQFVGTDEHTGTERLEELARRVELEDGIDARARPAAGRPARAGVAAPIDDPNRSVRSGGDARRRSPFPSGWELTPVRARPKRIGQVVPRPEQRHGGKLDRVLAARKDRLLPPPRRRRCGRHSA